ncbi:MAG: peptidoglycan-binding domain-containing protein [Minisyncoccia bacterium]
MNKYIVIAIFVFTLLISPLTTHAGGLTSSQVNAVIALLSSFGADSSMIANVQIALTGSTNSSVEIPPSSPPHLTKDLMVGSTGADVIVLQNELIAKGYLSTNATGVFGPLTKGALSKWQMAVGINPTGYFGPKSREEFSTMNGLTVNVSPITDHVNQYSFPLCGQPPMPVCSAGMSCAQVMPQPKTYDNETAFINDKASYLYKGICK